MKLSSLLSVKRVQYCCSIKNIKVETLITAKRAKWNAKKLKVYHQLSSYNAIYPMREWVGCREWECFKLFAHRSCHSFNFNEIFYTNLMTFYTLTLCSIDYFFLISSFAFGHSYFLLAFFWEKLTFHFYTNDFIYAWENTN